MNCQVARGSRHLIGALGPGDRRTLARLLSWIEAGDDRGIKALSNLINPDPPAYVVGITGPPGAGKSTLTRVIIELVRKRKERVAVLAIDPSSPFSGGALLGDRIRMTGFDNDEDVYIRSMAARKRLGGLSVATPAAARALSAFGFDWVLIETVGVGQSEIDISDQADSTVLVVSPGWGDHIQASKAGLIEVADLIAVNKADHHGSEETVREIEAALRLGADRPWSPPVGQCTALSGDGVGAIWTNILNHREFLMESGQLDEQRRCRRLQQFRQALREAALQYVDAELDRYEDATLTESVASGERDPIVAASLLHDVIKGDHWHERDGWV